MKRIHSLYLFAAIASLFFFAACQREIDHSLPTPDPGNPAVATPVKTSLTGMIVDEAGLPFAGVTVKTGAGNTAVTDSRGSFRFNNITLDKFTSLITAEIAGYFKGYRVFAASDKGTNFVKIQLLKRNSAGTINAATGGSVNTGGYTITLPASGVVVKSTGAAYSGTITVFAQPIDPTQNNITDIIPGSFLAIDSTNRRTFLQSFGMIAVELQGAGGEVLQIANGKKAGVDFAIPASRIASAPASIALWYVDETTGIWKQEGRAVKAGNIYKAEVGHFTFWNCDLSFEEVATFLTMKLKNSAGYPVPYAKAKITWDLLGDASIGYTDSTGSLILIVPKNYPLKLSILDDCNAVVYTRSLAAITQPMDLGTIVVDFSTYEVPVAGTVKNCNGALVTNGWVTVNLNNIQYNLPLDNAGHFGMVTTSCQNSTITIFANDIANTQTSPPYYYTVRVDPTNNLSLVACGTQLDLYNVTTYAGDGNQIYLDGPALSASFFAPSDVCRDAAGNIYVTDNTCIRKITPAGLVSTFAGNTTPGYADGNAATARFDRLADMVMDGTGNLIVADGHNNCIRKITPAGIVTTIAGDGTRGFGGFANGTGTAALFDFPCSVVVDAAGNIYVIDSNNDKVRKITTTGVVTTYAGTIEGFMDGTVTTCQFKNPSAIAIDASGNLLIADGQNLRIRKIATNGTVTTIAGTGTLGQVDGPALSATFQYLSCLQVDTDGSIIIGDYTKLRKLSVSGVVSTIAGSGSLGYLDGLSNVAQFSGLNGFELAPNRTIFVADVMNRRIRKLVHL